MFGEPLHRFRPQRRRRTRDFDLAGALDMRHAAIERDNQFAQMASRGGPFIRGRFPVDHPRSPCRNHDAISNRDHSTRKTTDSRLSCLYRIAHSPVERFKGIVQFRTTGGGLREPAGLEDAIRKQLKAATNRASAGR
jgi:hypothetical protein